MGELKVQGSCFEKPLRRAVMWPLLGALVLAVFLLNQVSRLIKTTEMVDHSDQVISEARRAKVTMVDTQANLQSYLLYHDNDRLQIFLQNLNYLPNSLNTLNAMVSDNESMQAKIRGLVVAENHWITRARARILSPQVSGWVRKRIIDEIRTRFDDIITEEEKIRAVRLAESQESGQNVLRWGCGLLIALGLFCSLYTKRVLKNMNREHNFLLTEAQLNLDRLSHLATELNHAVEVREDFLSIASHELKTPLTSLKLQVQTVERAVKKDKMPSTEQMIKALGIFHQQVSRLTEFIENLLDLSKLRQGRLHLEFSKIDFSKLVAELAERVGEQWVSNKELFELDIRESVEVFCDRFRMEQAILNLLTNAMKYGEGKPVKVQLAVNHGMCVLKVRDNGMGIEKEKQKAIFDRYERAVSQKHIAGLGLGLFIARQNVLAHHGSIEVDSEVGQGSTFTMKIPLMPNDIRDGVQLTV